MSNCCSSKKRQNANSAKESRKDDKEKDKKGKKKENASAAKEENEGYELAWLAINKDKISHLDAPTIDCSEIAEAVFIASEQQTPILFDTGATSHMMPLHKELKYYEEIPPCTIEGANANTFSSNGKGTLHIETHDSSEQPHFFPLQNTLHIPGMPNTLVSIGKLDDAGYIIHIEQGQMNISNGQGRNVACIPKVNGLYQIIPHEHAYAATNHTLSLYQAHCTLGHVNYGYLKNAFKAKSIQGIRLNRNHMEETECAVCMQVKAFRVLVSKQCQSECAKNFGDKMHTGIWGPASVKTIHQNKYALILLDNATYWLEQPLLCTKDGAFPRYVIFQTNLETQHSIIIKILHSHWV